MFFCPSPHIDLSKDPLTRNDLLYVLSNTKIITAFHRYFLKKNEPFNFISLQKNTIKH